MAEQDGLPGIAPAAQPVNVMTAPAEQQAPPAQTPQPQPSSGGGKTVEQLAAELEEQASYVRDTQEKLARMEHERELERQMYANLTAGKPQQQETIPEPKLPTDDEWISGPAKASAQLLEAYRAMDKAERERESKVRYLETARPAFEQGKAKAVKSNPELFKGISGDVEAGMLETISQGVKTGNFIDPSLFGEQFWELAAVARRLEQGETMAGIMTKYYKGSSFTPMAPVHTETPSAGNPPQAGMTLTPEQEELIAKGNITREQFLESMGKVRAQQTERGR